MSINKFASLFIRQFANFNRVRGAMSKSEVMVADKNSNAIEAVPKSLGELKNLDDFVYKEQLGSIPEKKMIFILCHNTIEDKPAVLILHKKPFPENDNDLRECIRGLKLTRISDNDIHLCADATLPDKFTVSKSTFIYPATQNHIAKYRSQPSHVIFETPEDYKNITLPFILSVPFSINWVYNIIDGKKDQEIVLIRDLDPETGFCLFKDLKWDGKTAEDLYYQAIVVRKDLKSVRDLTQKELPLLENVWNKGTKAIFEKHGIPASRLKVHFHYQPTYYHLHIHFRYIGSEANTPYVYLKTAIENIKLIPDYYQRATLQFVTKEGSPLFEKFKETGRI